MKTLTHILAALSAALTVAPAIAVTPLQTLRFTGDTHHLLPASGGGSVLGSDDALSEFDVESETASNSVPLMTMDGAGLDGYDAASANCTPDLYSLDNTADIAGTVMRPADVFSAAGVKFLDAAAANVPEGVNVDALSRDPANCDLIISVDVTTSLSGVLVRRDDRIRYDGNNFSLERAGGTGGDLDALHVLDTGAHLISFTTPPPDLGFDIADEDIIEESPMARGGGFTYELAFSPAQYHSSWEAIDLKALWAQRLPFFGQFRWSVNSIEAAENGPAVSLTIERINGSEEAVTLSYATVADSATGGMDFVEDDSTAEFGDGETSAEVLTTLLDDPDVEGNEQFFVDLTGITEGGGSLIAPTRVTILIRDDEDFVFADGFEN